MAINEYIAVKAGELNDEERNLIDSYHEFLDHNNQINMQHHAFEGTTGTVDFADEVYRDLKEQLAQLDLENMDPLDKETAVLETLVEVALPRLNENEKVQQWVTHYNTLNEHNGFEGEGGKQRKIQTLMKAIDYSLGLSEKDINQFIVAATSDEENHIYAAAAHLKKVLPDSLIRARIGELEKKITDDYLLHERAKAYTAQKIRNEQNFEIADQERYHQKDIASLTQEYYKIKNDLDANSVEEMVRKMGYQAHAPDEE